MEARISNHVLGACGTAGVILLTYFFGGGGGGGGGLGGGGNGLGIGGQLPPFLSGGITGDGVSYASQAMLLNVFLPAEHCSLLIGET